MKKSKFLQFKHVLLLGLSILLLSSFWFSAKDNLNIQSDKPLKIYLDLSISETIKDQLLDVGTNYEITSKADEAQIAVSREKYRSMKEKLQLDYLFAVVVNQKK